MPPDGPASSRERTVPRGHVSDLMEFACTFGHDDGAIVAVHDDSVPCAECWTAVCGTHADASQEDDELLCPDCYAAEQRRLHG